MRKTISANTLLLDGHSKKVNDLLSELDELNVKEHALLQHILDSAAEKDLVVILQDLIDQLEED